MEPGNRVVLLRLEEWGDPAPKQAREFLGVPLPKHWEVGTGPETPSLGPLAGNFPSQLA